METLQHSEHPEDGRAIIDIGRKPVVFTLAELWFCHDFVRHEMQNQEEWFLPPVSKEFNREIASAIVTCTDNGLEDYALMLSEHDMLVLDYHIRAAFKTPEGAKGKDILLKIFRARDEGSLGPLSEEPDLDYKTAVKNKEKEEEANANNDPNPDDSSNEDTDDDPVT